MRTGVAALLAALAAVATPSRPARATCAQLELGPSPITRTGAAIPEGGGFLVGFTYERDATHARRLPDPSQIAYTATAEGKRVELVPASLAPGLTVYKPRTGTHGKVALLDGKTHVLDATFGADKGAALPAPHVTSLTVSTQLAEGGRSFSSTTHGLAAVTSVPDGAVGLIVYAVRDEEHVPLVWGVPAHDKRGATVVAVFEGGGHCAPRRPPGEGMPGDGERVVFAWVDAYGRLSPVSDAVPAKVSL